MSKKQEPGKLNAGPEFDALMGKLAHVPKEAADRADKAWRKARKRKKKRKSDEKNSS